MVMDVTNTQSRLHTSLLAAVWLSLTLLTACGGGGGGGGSDNNNDTGSDDGARLSIGGTISNLSGTIVLVNQSGSFTDSIRLSQNGSFQFSRFLRPGQSYSVSVAEQPSTQECSVSNASGTLDNTNITSVAVSCEDVYTISGTVSASIAVDHDNDVNDPYALYLFNNTFASAQAISNNFATIHGFASAEGVSRFGLSGRFADSADRDDFYRVTLQADQRVQLQVVDHRSVNDSEYFGELDLFLYRYNASLNSYETVAASNNSTAYDEVTVPTSGEYFIQVSAFGNTGAAKYVLRLAPDSTSSTHLSGVDVNFVPGEMLVLFKDQPLNTTTSSEDFSHLQLSSSTTKSQRPVRATIDMPMFSRNFAAGTQPSTTEYDAKMHTLQAIKQLRQRDDIVYAEPNYIVRAAATPNDTLYNFQWHYPLIFLPQAWDITTGGTSGDPVIVAVIDTGVYLAHPDLQDQLTAGYDFISSASNARDGNGIDSNPDDPGDNPRRGSSSWHGTHVAATVAAETNEGLGAAGAAWQARIMPIRVLGTEGGTTNDLIEGIRFAARLSNSSGTLPAQAADIINLSLGGSGYSQALQDTINAVTDRGVIVIAAAGNENSRQPFYPAAHDNVFSVSAVNFNKQKASYSNLGPSIDLAAPGGEISQDQNGDGRPDGVLSAVADDSSGVRVPAWAFYQGTSMAAPHVAGVAALMKAVHSGLSPADFDTLVRSGSITEDLGAAGRDDSFGYGLINANLAVREAQRLANGGSLPAVPPQLAASPFSLNLSTSSSASLTLSNIGGNPDPTNITITPSQPWLSTTPTSVDSNGLGTYLVLVDRTGLEPGVYQAELDVSFNNNGMPDNFTVVATMRVGASSSSGRLSTQYILLADPYTSEEQLLSFVIAEEINGTLQYQVTRVAAGDYYIFSSSDIDNDGSICELGESCGIYPSLIDRQIITISEDRDDLDIIVDVLGGLNPNDTSTNTQGFGTTPLLQRQLDNDQQDADPINKVLENTP